MEVGWLTQYLARSGVCSRRQAVDLVKQVADDLFNFEIVKLTEL